MHEDRLEFRQRADRRWKVLAMLSLALLGLHAALLGGLDSATPPAAPPMVPPAMQVRTVEEMSDAAPQAAEPAPLPAKPPAAVPTPRPPRRAVAAAALAAPAPPPMADPTDAPIAVLAQQTAAPEPGPAAAPARAEPAPAGGDEPVPVYRTHAPPAANLRFVMQRGLLRGNAELSWRPAGKAYELHLDGRIAGLTILSQVSQGGFDAAGLAPVRFTDQRLRGAVNAANFQRQAGKVTFSGPQTEFALQPGVQDRLSWMVQLPAIVAGEPALRKPGARVALHVIGARADAAVWVLRYVGRESVDVAGVAVDAEKFSREESGPHDTAVDIWLDPQRHHLPIRATLRNGGDNDALELILQEMTMGP